MMNFDKLRSSVLTLSLIAAGGTLLMKNDAVAFDPNEPDYGHSFITRSIAGEGFKYGGNEVKAFDVVLVPQGPNNDEEKLTFSEDAVDQLVMGVQAPDRLNFVTDALEYQEEVEGGVPIKGEPFSTSAHCDDSDIQNCSLRIEGLTNLKGDEKSPDGEYGGKVGAVDLLFRGASLINKAEPSEADERKADGYGVAARVQVGRALHTLQDFYAHSNWSDFIADGSIFTELGISNDVTTRVSNPRTTQTCVARDIPLATWMALINLPIEAPLADRVAAWLLSVGPEGIKDVNSAILNWDTSGGNYQYVSTGNSDPNSLPITSGFFLVQNTLVAGIESAPNGANSQCDHGLGKAGVQVSGINKDAPWTPFKPRRVINCNGTGACSSANPSGPHAMASWHAALHTKKIFENVIDNIKKKTSDPELQKKMIEIFMGRRPAVTFVVDRTGSMQDIIDGIATRMREVAEKEMRRVDSSGNTVIDRSKKFALISYGEKANLIESTIHRFGATKGASAGKASEVEAEIRKIKASGGGDCQEPTFEALMKAARQTRVKGKIFVFTDASSKEYVGMPELLNILRTKKISVIFSVSGSCSPVDPKYYALAQGSGGQMLLVDHTSVDTKNAFNSIAAGSAQYTPVHVEYGTLAAGSSKIIEIPVESGVDQFSVMVDNEAGKTSLRDPSGKLQTLTPYLGGAGVQIDKAIPGKWLLEVAVGNVASRYSVNVRAVGAFDLLDVSYQRLEKSTGSAHEMNAPYRNNPPANLVAIAAQMKTNNVRNPLDYRWEAVADDGSVLGSINMSRNTPDQYSGTVNLGDISANGVRPWRVRVKGTDMNGQPFARVMPILHTAVRHSIEAIATPAFWVAGAKHKVRLSLKNFGQTDVFGITASTPFGSVAHMAASSRQMASGGVENFDLEVQIPANATGPALGELKFDVVSAAAGNKVVETVAVQIALQKDSDGDGVPDGKERGASGKDDNFDGNGDGIADWKQSEVISAFSDQGRGYMTASLSSGQFRLSHTLPAVAQADAVKFGLDLLDFKIVGVTPGAQVAMKLLLPSSMTAAGYAKFGPETGNLTPHWYDFKYDAASKTGAQIANNQIVLNFVDGLRGDDDLRANGEIIDLGGPTYIQPVGNSSVPTPTPTPTPGTATIPPAGGSSGGGGCTVGQPGQNDMSLPLLSILALAGIAYRRRRSSARAKR